MGFKNVKYASFRKRASRVHAKCRSMNLQYRLSIFRSNRHMCVQLIDDFLGFTLYSASTMNKKVREKFGGRMNRGVVLELANLFVDNLPQELSGVSVVFDKGGYKYGGNIKLFADVVRCCLKF